MCTRMERWRLTDLLLLMGRKRTNIRGDSAEKYYISTVILTKSLAHVLSAFAKLPCNV